MRFQSDNSDGTITRFFKLSSLIAALAILVSAQTVPAQCLVNPTAETAVGLKNASSYFLTFYIDGVNHGGVAPGDRSVDFIVLPGEHTLRADALINGEPVSASRTATIPAGYVCTWTVTDPPKVIVNTQQEFHDSLRRELWRAFITVTVPNG